MKDRRVADRGRRLLAGHMLIEIRSQALDGIARGQPGGTVELARLSHLAIGDAGDALCGLEVITGQRRSRGMFADHGQRREIGSMGRA